MTPDYVITVVGLMLYAGVVVLLDVELDDGYFGDSAASDTARHRLGRAPPGSNACD